MSEVFEELCSKFDLNSRGYTVSECCEHINKSLSSYTNVGCISNRQLKNLLIEKYGDKIGFTYPRKRNDSQMFYSINIKCTELAEQLQSNELLRKELPGDDVKSHMIFEMTDFPN